MTGEELPESVPEPGLVRFGVLWGSGDLRLRMPFFTAARTSARSFSPPTMLRLALELSVPELSRRSLMALLATTASIEFLSSLG